MSSTRHLLCSYIYDLIIAYIQCVLITRFQSSHTPVLRCVFEVNSNHGNMISTSYNVSGMAIRGEYCIILQRQQIKIVFTVESEVYRI